MIGDKEAMKGEHTTVRKGNEEKIRDNRDDKDKTWCDKGMIKNGRNIRENKRVRTCCE